jgi:hypothetical protein
LEPGLAEVVRVRAVVVIVAELPGIARMAHRAMEGDARDRAHLVRRRKGLHRVLQVRSAFETEKGTAVVVVTPE